MQSNTHYGTITHRWRLSNLSIYTLGLATLLMFAAAMILDFDFDMSHADTSTSQTNKCIKESYSTIRRSIEESGLKPNSTEWRRMRDTMFRDCMEQAFITGLKGAP
jgi:hypothetical protein